MSAATARLNQEVAKTAVSWDKSPDAVRTRFDILLPQELTNVRQRIAKALMAGEPAPTDAVARAAEIEATLPLKDASVAAAERLYPTLVHRHEAAKDAYRRAVHAGLVAGPVTDARKELEKSFDDFGIKLMRLKGLVEIAYGDFNPGGYRAFHVQDSASELLEHLIRAPWHGSPFEIRPSWCSKNNPADLSGVEEGRGEALAWVAAETAA